MKKTKTKPEVRRVVIVRVGAINFSSHDVYIEKRFEDATTAGELRINFSR